MIINEFNIRQATLNDMPFLVDTIIEAEKSGTNILTYTTIFGLSEIETREYIAKMLDEEIDGCELSVSGFILAEKDEKIVGAVGAWVEGSEDVPSHVLKGNLLNYVLPKSCLEKAMSANKIVRDLHIEYIENTIQIGLVYVAPEARGKGLVPLLINHKIKLLQEKFPNAKDVYIQVFGNNVAAIRAYEKAGFIISIKKTASLPETVNFMPDISKVVMKKK